MSTVPLWPAIFKICEEFCVLIIYSQNIKNQLQYIRKLNKLKFWAYYVNALSRISAYPMASYTFIKLFANLIIQELNFFENLLSLKTFSFQNFICWMKLLKRKIDGFLSKSVGFKNIQLHNLLIIGIVVCSNFMICLTISLFNVNFNLYANTM